MKSQIRSWIKGYLSFDPPRSKSLVVTIFGDSIAPHGGSVWLGSLIELMAPFGVGERLVRSSVFRLAGQGWIEAQRQGRRSRYSLTASGKRRFEQAYRKIYSRPREAWDSEWTMVYAGLAQLSANQRSDLRRELLWEGFRPLGHLTFLRPGGDKATLADILDRAGLRNDVIVCSVRDPESFLAHPLRRTVPKLWDLEPVEDEYRHFIHRFQKLCTFLKDPEVLDPELLFVVRTILIHAFRRVVLNDPLLPAELLPQCWQGADAYTLCRSIYQISTDGAERHLAAVLGRGGATVIPAATYFYERFGGLEHSSRSQTD